MLQRAAAAVPVPATGCESRTWTGSISTSTSAIADLFASPSPTTSGTGTDAFRPNITSGSSHSCQPGDPSLGPRDPVGTATTVTGSNSRWVLRWGSKGRACPQLDNCTRQWQAAFSCTIGLPGHPNRHPAQAPWPGMPSQSTKELPPHSAEADNIIGGRRGMVCLCQTGGTICM